METNAKPKVGRPPVSEKERERIIDKLAPYLSSGMSLGKAVERSGVPRSTVYKVYREDEQFMDNIKTFQKAFTVVVKYVIATELMRITARQDKYEELTRDDKSFIQWIANTNNQMRKYYGNDKSKDEESNEAEYVKDPKSLKTLILMYEKYRIQLIEKNYMTPDDELLRAPGVLEQKVDKVHKNETRVIKRDYLIRHAESLEVNETLALDIRKDPPLGQIGLGQAEQTRT